MNALSRATPKLLGKTAAVTGASRGIGLAIAQRFASEGAKVILLGRNEQRLLLARNEIAKFSGVEKDKLQLELRLHDVRLSEDWTDLAKAHPNMDILVNCAGVTQASPLPRTHPDTITNILHTNLEGAIFGCKSIGRRMVYNGNFLGNPGGCIINISSLLATKGLSGTSVYAASKAGLLGLTTSLAAEYAPAGVRVNAIVPGYIDTEMTKDLGDLVEKMKIPLGRLGTTEEVADAAMFLATNEYATNCILNLDGGLSAI
ncbi:hypothetical protein B0T16DRAFT_236523 [Cercophora newfieldiana]|uniref:Uncharacterized protein n=1 Tax=Cercophora newfieldiana TaxID=92897 RepID=A0AA39XU01_9PEZI|nr:hypothetical protein B0T16DRAFT_236523 [Cercophora newfieldiana]